jgi:hypothetical protein
VGGWRGRWGMEEALSETVIQQVDGREHWAKAPINHPPALLPLSSTNKQTHTRTFGPHAGACPVSLIAARASSLPTLASRRRYVSRCRLSTVVVAEDRDRTTAAAARTAAAAAAAAAPACASRRGRSSSNGGKRPMMMMVAGLASIPPNEGPDAAHASKKLMRRPACC